MFVVIDMERRGKNASLKLEVRKKNYIETEVTISFTKKTFLSAIVNLPSSPFKGHGLMDAGNSLCRKLNIFNVLATFYTVVTFMSLDLIFGDF